MAAITKTATCCNVLTTLAKRSKYLILSTQILQTKHYSTDAQNYDIIITGGGMVGTTLACAIANNKILEAKKVLLLESSKQLIYNYKEQYSNRVVALNEQTRTLLSSIGAWSHIKSTRYCPVEKMQVWDSCSDAMIIFNEDFLRKEIAYIVENDLLIHAVNKQLAEKQNVDVIYNSKVEHVTLPKTQGEYAEVQLQTGIKYRTKLLVGADGVNSLVRKTMSTQYIKWNYNQMGVVATLKLSEPTENVTAWQRFLPEGPIALLPLTNSLSTLVWSLPTDKAKWLLNISEEEFVDNLNDALWKVFPKDGIVESGLRALRQLLEGLSLDSGSIVEPPPSVSAIVEGSRAAFPLQFGHSVIYVQLGTVLVGDAAHRIHPLAGQGVNLGFGDIIELVKLLTESTIDGAPLGDVMYLKKYETLRQRYNVPTMLAIDALHRLYKGTAAPIVLARSLGLQLANALPIVKGAIIDHAAGQRRNV